MDNNQIQTIRNLLDTLTDDDIDNGISVFYKNENNLEVIAIGQFNVVQYVLLLKKLFFNFRNIIDTDLFTYLPFTYNFTNDFGNGQLNTDLPNLINSFKTNQFPNSVNYLQRLIYYQIQNNFWNLGDIEKKIDKSEINAIHNRLNTLSKHYQEYTDQFNILMKDVEDKKNKLEEFRTQKFNELQEITNNLQASRNHINEITTLLTNSISYNEKINSIFHQTNQKFDEIEKLGTEESEVFKKQKETFKSYQQTISQYLKDIEEHTIEYKNFLTSTDEKMKYFTERNQYLDELIGREVGASLFETFKQRKIELNNPVRFWKWSVPVMSLATVGWIIYLFHGNGTNIDVIFWWETFAINTLKSIPPIFLMFFSLSQYKKERNFQEEYAFKSAVALTIEAYANRLIDEKNKDDLVMRSVSEVYRSPIEVKYTSNDEKPSKQILETVKNMSETVKEVMKK